jgi:transcriptional regulator of nitric oxide reductase
MQQLACLILACTASHNAFVSSGRDQAALVRVGVLLLLQYVFMDQDTYEETRLGRDDWAKFLKEGAICSLLFYSGKVSFSFFFEKRKKQNSNNTALPNSQGAAAPAELG